MNPLRKAAALIGLSLILAGAPWPCRGATVYSIQVAASTDKATAMEASEEMNRMGHHAFVRLETVPGKGRYHRVYVERFGTKAQADKEAAMLKSLGLFNECYVRALKEDTDPRPPLTPPPRKEGKVLSGRVHFLHVASFSEKGNAEKEVARLEKRGQNPFYVEENAAGKRWFRTYIGEFKDVQEAQTAGSRLREKGLISYFKVISFSKGGGSTAGNTKAGKGDAGT